MRLLQHPLLSTETALHHGAAAYRYGTAALCAVALNRPESAAILTRDAVAYAERAQNAELRVAAELWQREAARVGETPYQRREVAR